jgi:hypothetical protein
MEAPRYVEEHYEGEVTYRVVDGRSHVVYGAWQVVIRGIGASAERKVLAVWEIHRSWITDADASRHVSGEWAAPTGGSEQRVPGASERSWRAASELRLGGASELYLLGASELRYLGASEVWFAGASERLHVGASEQVWPGASEHRPRYPSGRVGPAAPRG